MKRTSNFAALIALLFTLNSPLANGFAQGTAFTYQGRLNNSGVPANGGYDFRFRLATDAVADSYAGGDAFTTNAPVTNGLFLTTVDFGPGLFAGSNYWLEVDVRTNNPANTLAYTILTPLQAVTPTPYAIFANGSSNLLGTVSATQLSGTLTAAQLPPGVVTNNAGSLTLSGAFTGNGVGVTNVNAAALNGVNATNLWQLTGNNVAVGQFLGSTNNQPVIVKVSGQEAMRFQATTDTPDVVGGYVGNVVQTGQPGVTIGGGGTAIGSQPNIVTNGSPYATIGGGLNNTVSGGYGGGVFAGSVNYVGASFAFIGEGQFNTNQGAVAFLGGGQGNAIQPNAAYSFLGGGVQNLIESGATNSVLVGGFQNTIQANVSGLVCGEQNSILTNADNSFLGGGYANSIQPGAFESVIGGGLYNFIEIGDYQSVLVGGSENSIQSTNVASFLGGGYQNTMETGARLSVLVGGDGNDIAPYADHSFLGGGGGNSIEQSASYSFLGGGADNITYPDASYSFLGGGSANAIVQGASYSFLGGGDANSIQAGAVNSFLGGGDENSIGVDVAYSFLGGGSYNTIGNSYCVVPGGAFNYAAGEYSFAAGQQAQALYRGDFVWADSQNAVFDSTTTDQFCIRAQGGVQLDPTTSVYCGSTTRQMLNLWSTSYGIGVQGSREYFRAASGSGFAWFLGGSHTNVTDNPGVGGTVVMLLTSSGLTVNTTFVSSSDRNVKTGITPVDTKTILAKVAAMPITRWQYTNDLAAAHVGPMAQDFYAAFNVGPDDRHITSIDEGGVALAAIQGLNQKVEAKDVEIQTLKQQNESLVRRLDELEQAVQSLAQKK